MRRKGFEPSHPYGHMRLKHACLPFHHLRETRTIILFFEKMKRSVFEIDIKFLYKVCLELSKPRAFGYNKAILMSLKESICKVEL